MINISKKIWIVVLLMFAALHASPQAKIDSTFNRIPINYRQFLALVGKSNLNYAAQKLNLNISFANVEMAKIFPDPEIGVGWFDNGMSRMGMGYGFNSSIIRLIELGGVRKARIDLAKSETILTSHVLQNYLRNLRADATLNYLAALENKYLLDVKINSYRLMNQIAGLDSLRFQKGSITEMDWRQSKIESATMLNGAYESLINWKASLLDIGLMVSKHNSDSLYFPVGDFSKFERDINLSNLIIEAQNNRADLLAASQNKAVTQKMVQLAKANRVGHLEVGLRVGFASYDYNIVAPTPSFTQISGGIAFPIKFSNKYAGELKMAHYANLQADLLYKQAEVQIQIEVTQAYQNYVTTKQRMSQFKNGLLNETRRVRDGKIYSYQRGATTILEVLITQRTYNDIQEKYYTTLYDYASALVELERAVGIWDIDF